MVRYMAAQLGPAGIRFNAVAPGPYPHRAAWIMPSSWETWRARPCSAGSAGQDEMAGPTAFLLSDAASYVTDHCLNVDGGWTAW